MANLTTSQDIINYVSDRMSIADDDSQWDGLLVENLNKAQHSLMLGGLDFAPEDPVVMPWAVAQYPKILNLEAFIETGTISVTNDSTSVSFSSAPSASVANWILKVDGHEDFFRISSHTGGQTSATLDAKYTGDTDATANYKIFKHRYTIGSNDIHTILSPAQFYRTHFSVSGKTTNGLITITPGQAQIKGITQGIPDRAWIVYENSGNIDLQFNKYVDELVRIEIPYVPIPTDLADDSTEPIVPRLYRHVLADMVLYYMLVDKNDGRSTAQFQVTQRNINGMNNFYKNQISSTNRFMGAPVYRPDSLTQIEGPLRTDSGNIIG